jgi:HEAT repeat protein
MKGDREMKRLAQSSSENLDPRQLIEPLGSKDFGVSQAAAEALFAKGASALDALIEGMTHPNWRVRKNCAGLMDHLADDRCIEPLRRALKDPIQGVRRLAIHALGCQPCKPAPLQADIVGLLIERALSDTNIRVRRVAVHMLGLQPYDVRAVAALQAILDQETDQKLVSRAQYAIEEHRRKDEPERAMSCPTLRRRAALRRGTTRR